MICTGCNKLFIETNTKKLISLSKYKKLIREEMQKMGIPPFYTAYSLKHTTIQKFKKFEKYGIIR
jgi:phage FluMu protein Com